MPAKYKLRYLPVAESDLLSILEYIARDSPERSLKFVNKIDEKLSILETFPEAGRIPRHPKLKSSGYRVLFIESYVAFYKIIGHSILIHRVLHSSRDIDLMI